MSINKIVFGVLIFIAFLVGVWFYIHNSWVIFGVCLPQDDGRVEVALPADQLEKTLIKVFQPRHFCIGD